MKLSVITATYNAVEHLPKLIESLRNQEDKDFEWVVADGASKDGTLELLQSIKDLNIKISSQEDFGIYDALNRAIKISSGEFYLVVGADDILFSNAIKDYKSAINSDFDIITAFVKSETGISKPCGVNKKWIKAQFSYISCHAVGSIYRKSIHNRVGYYSRKFPIAADQLFILTAIKYGSRISCINEVVGYFNNVGVSSVDAIGAMCEWYRVQLLMGENKFTQTLIFILRLIKNYRKIR